MSIRLMSQVWEHEFSHAEQTIMLALADWANDDGGNVFPSVARIAWKTGYEERQVQRIMKKLRGTGVLVLVKRATVYRPNEYRIILSKAPLKETFETWKESRGDIMTPRKGGDNLTPERGDISGERGDIAVTPDPSLNPSVDPLAIGADAPLPVVPRKLTERQEILANLEKRFSMISGRPLPRRETKQDKELASKRWWQPLWRMYETANKDLEATINLMSEAVKNMRASRLTISAPQSVENVFVSLFSERSCPISDAQLVGAQLTAQGWTK